MVVLNSNLTHEHVLGELNLYASLVSVGSYCVVLDTVIEDLDGVEFLNTNSDFVVDYSIDEKLLILAAPDGYLKRVK